MKAKKAMLLVSKIVEMNEMAIKDLRHEVRDEPNPILTILNLLDELTIHYREMGFNQMSTKIDNLFIPAAQIKLNGVAQPEAEECKIVHEDGSPTESGDAAAANKLFRLAEKEGRHVRVRVEGFEGKDGHALIAHFLAESLDATGIPTRVTQDTEEVPNPDTLTKEMAEQELFVTIETRSVESFDPGW